MPAVSCRLYIPEDVFVALTLKAKEMGIPSYKLMINILTEYVNGNSNKNCETTIPWGSCVGHARDSDGKRICRLNHNKPLSPDLSECLDCPKRMPKP